MPVAPVVLPHHVLGGPHLACQRAQHEKGKLGSSLSENVRSMGKRNLVTIGVGTVDIVETYGYLRHNLQCSLARLKCFSVNRIAQSSDQAIYARLHFFDNQLLWRRLRLRVDLYLIPTLAKKISGLSYIGSSKYAELVGHQCL